MTSAADARLAAALDTGRQAALTLWLPVLVPLVTGMLGDCDHCLRGYLLSSALVPGVIVPALLQLDDAAFFVVGGGATLLLFAALWWSLHRLAAPWNRVLQAVVGLAIAAEAIGFANALRA
ncbi:MAG: hypothetical protein JNM25_18740 [Planctomycetes bacterium]|nr:hypothetical protein [Planctomycetota bacterium]